MKFLKNFGVQGDVSFHRITEMPSGYKPMDVDKDGNFVLAHSETGHNHVMEARPTVKAYVPESFDRDGLYDIVVEIGEDADNVELKHLRSYDTHESWSFSPGLYVFKPQSEYTPQGLKRAID